MVSLSSGWMANVHLFSKALFIGPASSIETSITNVSANGRVQMTAKGRVNVVNSTSPFMRLI